MKIRIDEIMKVLPPSFRDLDISNDSSCPSYIQHIAKDVEEAQRNFIKLVDEVLGTKYSGSEVHRRGIIGRIIDDSGNKELYKGWHRFVCIDDKYREWEQPYYAINEQPKSICVNKKNPRIIAYLRDRKLEEILLESELQKSVKNLINTKTDRERLDDFAKARYDETFPNPRKFDQGWHHYDSYQIINETTLRVKYKHGFGDYEYNESFDVDLVPYYRDEKLEKID